MLVIYLTQSGAGERGPAWTAIRSDLPGISGLAATGLGALEDLVEGLRRQEAIGRARNWNPIEPADAPVRIVVRGADGQTTDQASAAVSGSSVLVAA